MTTLILRTTTRPLTAILLVFSLFMLLRGHDHPGGGFIGGLVAGAAFSLYAMAYGTPDARKILFIDPRAYIGLGLLFSAGIGLLALVFGSGYLTQYWTGWEIPLLGGIKLGTSLIFDLGVYLVVTGMVCTVLFRELEET